MALKTEFIFTLPRGIGFQANMGTKITGVMRLAKVSDILIIHQDNRVKTNPSYFYVILITRVVTKLGTEKMVTTKTIENLCPEDFAFLVDFFNQLNHQLIRRVPLKCENCGHEFVGEFQLLGEA
jgi:hypothetical protein